MKKYLEKITGATLDIIGVDDATAGLFPEMSRIFVGDSSVARQLSPKVEWDKKATLGSKPKSLTTLAADFANSNGGFVRVLAT